MNDKLIVFGYKSLTFTKITRKRPTLGVTSYCEKPLLNVLKIFENSVENIRRTKCNFCKIPCLEAISLPSLRKFSEDLRVAASVKEKRSFPNFASNIKLIQDGGRYHIETSPLICSSEKL